MSNRQENDADTRPASKPSVIIAAAGHKRDVGAEYDNIVDTVFSEDDPAPVVFNKTINIPADIYCFLGPEHDFARPDAIDIMVENLWTERRRLYGAAYCDNVIVNKGRFFCHKFYPSFDTGLVGHQYMISTPLFVKSAIANPFDEQLEHLYLWDRLMDLMLNTMVCHVPKPLVAAENTMIESANIKPDLNLISAKYKTHSSNG